VLDEAQTGEWIATIALGEEDDRGLWFEDEEQERVWAMSWEAGIGN